MKRYKSFLVILHILMLLLITTSCEATTINTQGHGNERNDLVVSSEDIGFEKITSCYTNGDGTYVYYRDRTTDVMYVLRRGGKSANGFTAMLDPKTNGPLTYENWLAYLEAKSAGGQN